MFIWKKLIANICRNLRNVLANLEIIYAKILNNCQSSKSKIFLIIWNCQFTTLKVFLII